MTDQDPAPGDDDPAVAAAELAIGLRPRRRGDVDTTAVARWSERLAPLFVLVPAVTPADGLWPAIAARIDSVGRADAARLQGLRRSLLRWRVATTAGLALAAASIVALLGPVDIRSLLVGRPIVASLAPDNGSPLFTAVYEPGRGTLTLAPAAGAVTGPQVPQLWYVPSGGSPVSLGIIDPSRRIVVPVPATASAHWTSTDALAISLEPPGGSPTGAPTGPVVAHGALRRLD